MKYEERTMNFFSNANEMVKCPVPGCGHTGTVITKAHCRIVHGMTQEEVREKYSTPYRVTFKSGVFVNGI